MKTNIFKNKFLFLVVAMLATQQMYAPKPTSTTKTKQEKKGWWQSTKDWFYNNKEALIAGTLMVAAAAAYFTVGGKTLEDQASDVADKIKEFQALQNPSLKDQAALVRARTSLETIRYLQALAEQKAEIVRLQQEKRDRQDLLRATEDAIKTRKKQGKNTSDLEKYKERLNSDIKKLDDKIVDAKRKKDEEELKAAAAAQQVLPEQTVAKVAQTAQNLAAQPPAST